MRRDTELQDIPVTDAPVRSHPGEWQLALVQQLDQVGARNIKHVGSLLSGELCVGWHHGCGVALGRARSNRNGTADSSAFAPCLDMVNQGGELCPLSRRLLSGSHTGPCPGLGPVGLFNAVARHGLSEIGNILDL